MFKDTLCRKITYNLINNVFNNIYEKKSLEIMLTIFVITIARKVLFEIRLTTQQLPFLHSNILCKIVVNDQSTIKTYLKTYLKRKEDKDKNDEEEKRLKLFESLNDTQQIFSFEIVNSELENGFSSENDLEHSLQVNGFSPE